MPQFPNPYVGYDPKAAGARPAPGVSDAAYPDIDALLRGAKESLARADALQQSVAHDAAGMPVASPTHVPTPWEQVKKVANWSPLGDGHLGTESADLLDPTDLRDRKAASGSYSTWDTVKSGAAGALGGLIDFGRNTATPVGALTTFAPEGRIGRAATGLASGVIAGEGAETLADPNATVRDKAFGALNTILGLHGAARATHGLSLPEPRTGAGAKGEFSPWEPGFAQPAPPPVPEQPIKVLPFEGSGRPQPIAASTAPESLVVDRYMPNRGQATSAPEPIAAPEPAPAADLPSEPSVAPSRPRMSASDVSAMLRGRQKFADTNPGAELPPGSRDELDRMGVEYTRTQNELKRLLGMPDADPVETQRMSQGARELGSRLRKQSQAAAQPPPTPEPAAEPSLMDMLKASIADQETKAAAPALSDRVGHFKLPEAKVPDAVYEAARNRAGIKPSPLAEAEGGGGTPARSSLAQSVGDTFAGHEFPFHGNPEAGSTDLSALLGMARIPAGAAIGAYFDPENRTRGALIGGGLGAASLHPGVASNLERLRYFSMLMGPAQLKNIAGNVGVTASTAAERALTHGPAAGGKVLSEFFSPKTAQHAADVFRGRDVPLERMDQPSSTSDTGIMGLPFRAMGAADEATKGAMARAGVEDPAARTFTSDPTTPLGQAVMAAQRKGGPIARVIMPFVKTAVNQAEAGTTPFAALAHLGELSPAERRQALAKVAVLAGAGAAGAAYGSTDFASEHPVLSPFAAVLAGSGAVPFAVAQQFAHARHTGKNEPQALQAAGTELGHQLPMPSEWAFSPAALLASLVPTGLRSLNPDTTERDTTGSIFGPALARIPFLSRLLPAKGSPRTHTRLTRE